MNVTVRCRSCNRRPGNRCTDAEWQQVLDAFAKTSGADYALRTIDTLSQALTIIVCPASRN